MRSKFWPFFTQISGRKFLPELCGEAHPETAPFQALCCDPCSTEQSTFRRGEKGKNVPRKGAGGGRGVASKKGQKGNKGRVKTGQNFLCRILIYYCDPLVRIPCSLALQASLFSKKNSQCLGNATVGALLMTRSLQTSAVANSRDRHEFRTAANTTSLSPRRLSFDEGRRAPDYSSNLCPPRIWSIWLFQGVFLGLLHKKKKGSRPKTPPKKVI